MKLIEIVPPHTEPLTEGKKKKKRKSKRKPANVYSGFRTPVGGGWGWGMGAYAIGDNSGGAEGGDGGGE